MGPQFANDDGNEKSPDLGVKTNFEELNIVSVVEIVFFLQF